VNDFRETILRLSGERVVIRTERSARMTVAKLEADHTKAVKAAIVAHRVAKAEARYADTAATAPKVCKTAEQRYVKLGFEYGSAEGAGNNAVTQLMTGAEELRAKEVRAAGRFAKHTTGAYVDCRKGDAPIRYTSIDPDALVADWPGVTHETIDPNAPVVEPAMAPALSGADFLASLLASVTAA
jgi:hypothetical protein